MRRFANTYKYSIISIFLIITFIISMTFAEDQAGYLSVSGPCNLEFPRDHGPHPGYRTEWWYYTGNLKSETGRRYGFQLTFFRSQISPSGAEKKWPQPPSAWRTQQVYLGHAALTDIAGKKHLKAEIVARQALGMAGAFMEAGNTTVFVKNWFAQIGSDSHFLRVDTDDLSYELNLEPVKPPVLHGVAGYSRKGSTPERASCYYSITRLIAEGTLTLDGKTIPVKGLSWMDHE
ncbi:MAG: carotenoid 1,2-hydratase, partial [Desulfobacterales bacterium]